MFIPSSHRGVSLNNEILHWRDISIISYIFVIISFPGLPGFDNKNNVYIILDLLNKSMYMYM